ncbi:MAG: tetratricopeptide repeat protein [Deltaproteobacteria bacterium]|jgi:tetratricopeptide (TPR) repeat protein|nr:tetratricopeptide repeat protein [Deltaproteobacteria bacterium]
MNGIMSLFFFCFSACLLVCGCGGSALSVPDHLTSGARELNRGIDLYQKGCYNSALEHFSRAHELYSASDMLYGVAESLNDLGSAYQGMGECESAILCFDEAHALYLHLGKDGDAAKTLSNKAAVLIATGRLDKAEGTLNRASKLDKKAGCGKAEVSIMNNMGVLLTKKKEYDRAEIVLAGCLSASKKDPCQMVSACFAMGNLMLETGRYEKAVSYFSSALTCDRKNGFYKGIADDLFYMGLAFDRWGKEKESIERWKRSAKVYALLGCADEVDRVMKRLGESSVRQDVDITVTKSFVDRWLRGEICERLCP